MAKIERVRLPKTAYGKLRPAKAKSRRAAQDADRDHLRLVAAAAGVDPVGQRISPSAAAEASAAKSGCVMRIASVFAMTAILGSIAVGITSACADDDPAKPPPMTPKQFAERVGNTIEIIAENYIIEIERG